MWIGNAHNSGDQSAVSVTERGMPFDLIRVTHYTLKITGMRYLCGTVAATSEPASGTCHTLLDCTKLKTSHHKHCKTGEIQPFFV